MAEREELMQLHVVADESQPGHETFVMQAPFKLANVPKMVDRFCLLYLANPIAYPGKVQIVVEDNPRFVWAAEGGADG
jgi:hypothetical protein